MNGPRVFGIPLAFGANANRRDATRRGPPVALFCPIDEQDSHGAFFLGERQAGLGRDVGEDTDAGGGRAVGVEDLSAGGGDRGEEERGTIFDLVTASR